MEIDRKLNPSDYIVMVPLSNALSAISSSIDLMINNRNLIPSFLGKICHAFGDLELYHHVCEGFNLWVGIIRGIVTDCIDRYNDLLLFPELITKEDQEQIRNYVL